MKKATLLTSLVACAFLFTKCNNPKVETTTTPDTNPWTCTNTLDSMAEADINADSVDFSFVFMGCNRIDKDTITQTNASTANVFQLKRTFNEVCSMKIKPKFFFFLGDLVFGLDTLRDSLNPQPNLTHNLKLANELNAWVQQFQSDTFSSMPNSGIRLVAVPGNHEMLYKVKPAAVKKEEQPWAKAPAVWRSVMQAFSIQAPDDYGLTYGAADSLTYSFNYKGTHFILVNTDTYYPTQRDTPGLVPAAWIVKDIQIAHNTPTTKHIFVMGHKPAQIIYDSLSKKPLTAKIASNKDDIIKLDSGSVIWKAMENNQVEAMLTAHRHEFLVTQPHAGKTTQVIAGNAGSLYESHLPLNNQFFGYTKIYVMKNGQVIARSFGRLTPGSKKNNSYVSPLPCNTLTSTRYTYNITWGNTVQWFNPLDSIQNLLTK